MEPAVAREHSGAIFYPLTLHTVGFLKETKDEDNRRSLAPCGSGVLSEIGGIKGAITAAHVILELQKSPVAGLLTITNSKSKSRPLEFRTTELEVASILGSDPPNGPDLGFVRFPHEIEQRLIAENAFYNFDVRLAGAMIDDGTPLHCEVISGIVAEKSEQKAMTETTRIDTHTMVHAFGTATNFRKGAKGYDLFEFEVQHNEQVSRPRSYGGMSGSAVWKTGDTTAANDRLVFGIAFYESDPDNDGRRVITCHGPGCIYRELVELVRDRFGNVFKIPN